jgi:Tfp pilus assembly major pilin PilA
MKLPNVHHRLPDACQKIPQPLHPAPIGYRKKKIAGAFTLMEMMAAVGIFSVVAIGLLSLQIFGIKMGYLATNQLNATSGSLKALDQIRNLVLESSNTVLIGNYTNSQFTATSGSANPVGNAMMISNGVGSYFTFYVDTRTNILYEMTHSGGSSRLTTLAHSITNQQAFQAENYLGNPLTNNAQNYTIQMTLQFSQLDYTLPGGSNVCSYYQLQTRMTPRNQFWATE